ncbi:MAG: plasmid pRiA4b ORF-3 family protein, partial [Caldilinea sp.]
DDNTVRLSQVIGKNTKRFRYTYDFGDDWVHVIEVEKILPYEQGRVYPLCLAGKRACPPEDVGGVWGYESFLATLSDPSDPEHEAMLEWVGGEFDPEEFDIEEVNAIFANMSKR